jgi:carbon monoxide dehydrogenase subunit G
VIETEQAVTIDAGIGAVWTYVRDIHGWASLMPGFRECAIVDDDNSRWTLKVGVGGLVRTVHVLVQVDRWDGPENVDFRYSLEGDPVSGGGTYRAVRTGPSTTDVVLKVQVIGGGPLAPMWEAMGKPLLPQLAKAFAVKLKSEIEATAASLPADDVVPTEQAGMSVFASLRAWFSGLWRRGAGPASS